MTSEQMAALLGEAADTIDRALPPPSSLIDTIAELHPGWEVSREDRADRPDAWTARRGPVSLSAPSAAGLLVRLENRELSRLQAEHGGTYRVWRAGQWWMGTALVDGITPTLMEATAASLEARLRDPGPQYGAPYPREAL